MNKKHQIDKLAERRANVYVKTLSEEQRASLLNALTETGKFPAELPPINPIVWDWCKRAGVPFLKTLGLVLASQQDAELPTGRSEEMTE